jgi:hypothetical protein
MDTILLARGVMWILGMLMCIPLYKLARLYGDGIFPWLVLLLVLSMKLSLGAITLIAQRTFLSLIPVRDAVVYTESQNKITETNK